MLLVSSATALDLPPDQTRPDNTIATMACFTKSTADQAPLIHVDATKKLSKVNPNTYGGFTEYVAPHHTPALDILEGLTSY